MFHRTVTAVKSELGGSTVEKPLAITDSVILVTDTTDQN